MAGTGKNTRVTGHMDQRAHLIVYSVALAVSAFSGFAVRCNYGQ